ncbi:protein of unknown function [Streptantibioticus cattleyicolor NRRL 8057 = DSM 46488]|nr:protein of unknown function [Streptantibioticus cattleyicolor NRRL 8057 = DSM 46488]
MTLHHVMVTITVPAPQAALRGVTGRRRTVPHGNCEQRYITGDGTPGA